MAELRLKARAAGLPTAGRKAELLERLQRARAAAASAGPSAPAAVAPPTHAAAASRSDGVASEAEELEAGEVEAGPGSDTGMIVERVAAAAEQAVNEALVRPGTQQLGEIATAEVCICCSPKNMVSSSMLSCVFMHKYGSLH